MIIRSCRADCEGERYRTTGQLVCSTKCSESIVSCVIIIRFGFVVDGSSGPVKFSRKLVTFAADERMTLEIERLERKNRHWAWLCASVEENESADAKENAEHNAPNEMRESRV